MVVVDVMLSFVLLCWLLYSGGSWAAASLSRFGEIILDPAILQGTTNISTFLLDRSTGILYLGARGVILSVDTNNFNQQPRKIVWDLSKNERKLCLKERQKEADCHNYIRLLEFLGDGRVYVCGTYAFDPKCASMVVSSFTLENKVDGTVMMERAKGKFPHNPHFSFTAVEADGILYTATPTNFCGTKFAILRTNGPANERISSGKSKRWLYEPEFVSSTFIAQPPDNNPTGEDDYILFFFTEIGEEYNSHIKPRVSRVARVCKSDIGGKFIRFQKWTTFLKARLVCEDKANREHYNIVTDVFTLQHTPGDPSSLHFYALFKSLGETKAGAAVCVFNLSDINKVMDGPFKELEQGGPGFIPPEVPTPRPGQCINKEARKSGYKTSLETPSATLAYSQDHLLMENSVTAALLLLRKGIVYTKLAVTPMKNQNGQRAAVLHLGTDHGELHKVAVDGQETDLLQEINLFSPQERINNIMLYQGWALVGSPLSLARVPADGCEVFMSCELCAKARGLGCIWSTSRKTCMATETVPGEGDVVDAALKKCVSQEGRCNPTISELKVLVGQHVLLPCLQLSGKPCSWEHPSQRHAKQHHSHLEVHVSTDSLGKYVCTCPEVGPEIKELTPCQRAAYHLTLDATTDCELDLAGYMLAFTAGLMLGSCILLILTLKVKTLDPPNRRNSGSSEKRKDSSGNQEHPPKKQNERKERKRTSTTPRPSINKVMAIKVKIVPPSILNRGHRESFIVNFKDRDCVSPPEIFPQDMLDRQTGEQKRERPEKAKRKSTERRGTDGELGDGLREDRKGNKREPI